MNNIIEPISALRPHKSGYRLELYRSDNHDIGGVAIGVGVQHVASFEVYPQDKLTENETQGL